MRLVIDGFGKFIGVEGGMIVVREKKQTLRKIRAEDLKQIWRIIESESYPKATKSKKCEYCEMQKFC